LSDNVIYYLTFACVCRISRKCGIPAKSSWSVRRHAAQELWCIM